MIRSASARYCASVSGGAPTTGTSGGAANATRGSSGTAASAPACARNPRRVRASIGHYPSMEPGELADAINARNVEITGADDYQELHLTVDEFGGLYGWTWGQT